jgi:hypothetical protein
MTDRGPRKITHNRRGGETLARRCLRDGSIDVDLATGVVTSFARYPKGRVLKLTIDEDGYEKFKLCRNVSKRLVRKPDRWGRHRWQMDVFVHRLVRMKATAVKRAVAEAGDADRWREYVRDLPCGVDVNHIDRDRRNNAAANLRLETEDCNRRGGDMDEEDLRSIAEFETGDAERWREFEDDSFDPELYEAEARR